MLMVALLPAFILRSATGGTATILLVVGTLVFDALIRRQRKWLRYEREYTKLKILLSEEAVEDFYTESQEATKSPSDLDELARFGDRDAATSNPVHYLRYLWLRHHLREFPKTKGGRVLDLGTKFGLMISALNRSGASVVAADIDYESVKAAHQLHPDLPFLCSDAQAVSLRSNQFDLINFSEVLEHLSNPLAALGEIRRCLKPGGFYVLTTDNRHGLIWDEWLNLIVVFQRVFGLWYPRSLPPPGLIWEDQDSGMAFYHTDFHRRELIQWIREAGLEVLYLRSYQQFGEIDRLLLEVFPRWNERQAAKVLFLMDRILATIPIVRHLGLHWFIIGRRPKVLE
jgi:2-polyprenyl-3-methyl-5-hydroxy-6-metoxy-1,4-benzoquinol methylase